MTLVLENRKNLVCYLVGLNMLVTPISLLGSNFVSHISDRVACWIICFLNLRRVNRPSERCFPILLSQKKKKKLNVEQSLNRVISDFKQNIFLQLHILYLITKFNLILFKLCTKQIYNILTVVGERICILTNHPKDSIFSPK